MSLREPRVTISEEIPRVRWCGKISRITDAELICLQKHSRQVQNAWLPAYRFPKGLADESQLLFQMSGSEAAPLEQRIFSRA